MQINGAKGAVAVADRKPAADVAQVVGVNPFVRAAREHTEPVDTRSFQLGAASQQSPVIDIPAYGYLRHVWLKVTATGGAAGLNNAVAHEDAPWNVIESVYLEDPAGHAIQSDVDGFAVMLENLAGAYSFETDPRTFPYFSAVAVSGNFTFLVRVPVEISGRDALGALPNQMSNATYKLRYTVRANTGVYTTSPDTKPAVEVKVIGEFWSQPQAIDLDGRPNEQAPPWAGASQFWTRQPYNVGSGVQRIELTRRGKLIRTLVMIFRVAGARSTSNFPTDLDVSVDSLDLHKRFDRDLLRHYTFERYSVSPPTGVFILDFSHDMDYRPGNELRDLWLPTTSGSRIELEGTFGAAGTLEVLTNDVALPAIAAAPAQ